MFPKFRFYDVQDQRMESISHLLQSGRECTQMQIWYLWLKLQNWDKDQFTLGSQVFLQMLNSVHLWRLAREWKDFLPPILWFLYQDASFHERVRSHEYVQLLGQRSTHSLQGSDLYQRADVETFLRNSECNVRLSSDEHKHHNVCQLG